MKKIYKLQEGDKLYCGDTPVSRLKDSNIYTVNKDLRTACSRGGSSYRWPIELYYGRGFWAGNILKVERYKRKNLIGGKLL